LKPIWASNPRTSSATACRYALVCSGWPLKISGLPVIPVGQLGMWQDLHTMHPTDTISACPKLNSSAPSRAYLMTSWPFLIPPPTRSLTALRSR
jgi:hypothetical protein